MFSTMEKDDEINPPQTQSYSHYLDYNSFADYFDGFISSSTTSPNNVTSSLLVNCPYANEATHYTRNEFLAKIEQIVLASIFILTLAGNIVVLVGIYSRKQKMSRMYYFILHLSIADLTTAFFHVLPQLAWEITYRFQGGPIWCKVIKFTQILGPYSSSYILVATALDRYQAICFPLSNSTWNAKRSKMMLGTAWTLSLLFCVPQLFLFAYQDVGNGQKDCWVEWSLFPDWAEKAYLTWYCISVFIVPLIFLIFAYSCITRVIWFSFSSSGEMNLGTKWHNNKMPKYHQDDESDSHTLQDSVFHNGSPPMNNGSGGERTERQMLLLNGNHSPRNLEVSWKQRKSGAGTITTTRSSVSPNLSQIDELPSPTCPGRMETSKESNSHNVDVYHSTQGGESGKLTLEAKGKENGGGDTSSSSSGDTSKNEDDYNRSSPARQRQKVSSSSWRSSGGSLSSSLQSKKPSAGRTVSYASSSGYSSSFTPTPTRRSILARNKKRSTKSTFARSSILSNINLSRTHSTTTRISRAKIKTIKLTVTVICCYIICSTPFFGALLWMAYDPCAKTHPFYVGPTFTILTLLLSLNSCANAYIILFFNPVLLHNFTQTLCGSWSCCYSKARENHHPETVSETLHRTIVIYTSNNNNKESQDPRRGGPSTSITRLSPVANRNNSTRTKGERNRQEGIELIPSANENGHKNKTRIVASSGESNRVNTTPKETSFTDV